MRVYANDEVIQVTVELSSKDIKKLQKNQEIVASTDYDDPDEPKVFVKIYSSDWVEEDDEEEEE